MQSALNILMQAHPGKLRIPAVDAGQWIGFAPQSVRNAISRNTFPLPTHKTGALRTVDLRDLAAYLDTGKSVVEAPTPSVPARKRGRPQINGKGVGK